MTFEDDTMGESPPALETTLGYLWEEYRYRHDLVWRTVIRISFVVITLSALPYAHVSLVRDLGRLMVLPPLGGVVVAFYGISLIQNEVCLFATIKLAYRRLQNELFERMNEELGISIPLHDAKERSSFSGFVWVFMAVLILLSAANVFVVCDFLSSPQVLGGERSK